MPWDARQSLSDLSLPSGCQHSCLRALHALVTYTREPLAPLVAHWQLMDGDITGIFCDIFSLIQKLGVQGFVYRIYANMEW